ncbi:MAG: hypothetical protein KDC26_12955 [Armatimonadetes bacterium]|nr:hypothetical protein [Armatimonadota bacterium]
MLSATLLLAQIQTTDLDFQPTFLYPLVQELGDAFGETWHAGINDSSAYLVTGPGWTAPQVRERLAELTHGKWIGSKGKWLLIPDGITYANWQEKEWAEVQARKNVLLSQWQERPDRAGSPLISEDWFEIPDDGKRKERSPKEGTHGTANSFINLLKNVPAKLMFRGQGIQYLDEGLSLQTDLLKYAVNSGEYQVPMSANREAESDVRKSVVRFTRTGREAPDMRWMLVDEKLNVVEGFDRTFRYFYPSIDLLVFDKIGDAPIEYPEDKKWIQNFYLSRLEDTSALPMPPDQKWKLIDQESNPYEFTPAMALTELARRKNLRVSAKISSEWADSFSSLSPFDSEVKDDGTWRNLLKLPAARQLRWDYLPNEYGTSELVIAPRWEAAFPDEDAVWEAKTMWLSYAMGSIPNPMQVDNMSQRRLPREFPFKKLTTLLFPSSQYEMVFGHRRWTDPIAAWFGRTERQFFDGYLSELPVDIQQVISMELMSSGRQVLRNPDADPPKELQDSFWAPTDAQSLLFAPQYVWTRGIPGDTKVKLFLQAEDATFETEWRQGEAGLEARLAPGKNYSMTVLIDQDRVSWSDKTSWRTCELNQASDWKPVKRN